MTTNVDNRERLGRYLRALRRKYNRTEFTEGDPLAIPRAYADPADREIAAFFAAAFSYGRVAQILKSSRAVLGRLGDRPAATLLRAKPEDLLRCLRGTRHRFNDGRDIALFAWFVAQALQRDGSLGAHFERTALHESGLSAAALRREPDLQAAAARWMEALRQGDARPFVTDGALPERHTVRYLLPRPENGSACKRLAMFLRWMIRPDDGVDLGLWRFVAPSRLLMPVDTHVLRLSRHLGLTERRDASLRTSREITAALRAVAPRDPTRFDFALSRLGILAHCPTRERLELCTTCGLATVCRRRAALLAEAA